MPGVANGAATHTIQLDDWQLDNFDFMNYYFLGVDFVNFNFSGFDFFGRFHLNHGDLVFHQSGGCCDGSAPMCYPQGEFIIGDYDRLLGHIGGAPFYISGPQFEYWKHTQLIIDVVPGRGGMFSLDGPEGLRFLTRSRLFTETEWAKLSTIENEAAPLLRAVFPS